MIRILVGCIVAGALLGAPPPVVAQERSVGITYAPRLSLHDESTCCMAIGPWVSIDRLHVEYVIAWDHYWQERRAKYAGRLSPFTAPDAKVDGHLLTILGTLRTWRPTEQLRTRFQAGVRYGTATEPTPRAWGAGAGLTVGYLAGRTVLHGTFRLLWPKPPEFRIGLGVQF